jgi:hypothetical protein
MLRPARQGWFTEWGRSWLAVPGNHPYSVSRITTHIPDNLLLCTQREMDSQHPALLELIGGPHAVPLLALCHSLSCYQEAGIPNGQSRRFYGSH